MATTSSLIDVLATDLDPVRQTRPLAFICLGVAAGAVFTSISVIVAYGIQPGLMGSGLEPFVLKSAYSLSIAALALWGVDLLSQPGTPPPRSLILLVPIAILAVVAAFAMFRAPVADLSALLLGGTWRQCSVRIILVSLPLFAILFAVVRRQAPVRLRLAGGAIGLLSSSLAAAFYALACTEQSPAFVLLWYSLGIAVTTAVGSLLGPRLLHW